MDEEPLRVNDFANMYNKWLKELVEIENNLITKADNAQSLQAALNDDAETLRKINEKVLPLQIEQNCIEDHLESLLKEQEELEREISNLDDIDESFLNSHDEDEVEDYPVIFETIGTELITLKEQIKEMVNKVNAKKNDFERNNNPILVYRAIMDRYTDALQILEASTAEIHRKLDELDETD